MTSICFYISDYGYGHAARDIAIIRKLLAEFDDLTIYIKTDGPFQFVKQSLPQRNIKVIQTKNDIGLIFKENSINVDRERTKTMLDNWMASWNFYIQTEKEFCKRQNVNLILSDITPQPFIVANELGIPSIGISNFTWHYIFYNLFGDTSATERIKEAYQCADMALVLPFNEDMNLFRKKKEISLVSREITVDRRVMRRKCGVSNDELLVYVGVGVSFDPSFMRNMKKIAMPDVKFLVSSNAELPSEEVIRIQTDETETQNYIAMCDLVVSKAGYSTVSEAIRAQVPMVMFKREGYKEDELIVNAIEGLGIGRHISDRAFLEGGWLNELDELYIYTYRNKFDTMGGRYKEDGTVDILSAIREVAL